MFPRFSSPVRRDMRGSALIITLAVLVLISAVVLIFFSESTVNRQISMSSAGQYRADLTAHVGLDTIVGDLRTEIVAGSQTPSDPTGTGTNLYIPTTNFTAVPSQVDNNNQLYPNLVAQSASSSNFWSGVGYDGRFIPARSAANNSTATPSQNGRMIPAEEWNRPGLLGDPNTGTLYPQAPATAYTPPDWVMVTRAGAVTNYATLPAVGPGTTSKTLSDKTPSNVNFVTGRYAYAIYDEGGLIDINVAGVPKGMPADFLSKRGLLGQMNLTNLVNGSGAPVVPDPDTFVKWRNVATIQTPLFYTNYVFNTTNGFATVAGQNQVVPNGTATPYTVASPGDQSFVSRQDLIKYSQANPSIISTAALPYLATFTREVNAPSYTPPKLGNKPTDLRPATLAGNTLSGQDDQQNPSLITTRVINSFTRDSDQTTANPGEPLLKYRFPLSRLALFGNQNNATDSGTGNIFKFFGLSRTDAVSPWVYRNNAATILNLSQVAAAKREPDFFELLQAAIFNGSLAKIGVDGADQRSQLDVKAYYQVMQIGANLMDQYDSDSYPTRISFDNNEFDGIENLPYLSRVVNQIYRLHGSKEVDPTWPNLGVWFEPQVWNPHAGATKVNANGPTIFLFRIIPSPVPVAPIQAEVVADPDDGVNPVVISPVNKNFTTDPGITFSTTSSRHFNEPTLITSAPAIGGAPVVPGNDSILDSIAGGGIVRILGIWVQYAAAPDVLEHKGATTTSTVHYKFAGPQLHYQDPILDSQSSVNPPYVCGQLYYQLGANNWIPYSRMSYMGSPVPTEDDIKNPVAFTNAGASSVYKGHSDPRTDHMGALSGSGYPNDSMRPDASDGLSYTPWDYNPLTVVSRLWSAPSPVGLYLGCLSDNRDNSFLPFPVSTSYYTDNDGVTRRADGAYTKGGPSLDGYPLATGNPGSRPVMLDRPFRSVAEMGYAFRDEPWKHLDFFTQQSADAALLDLFCLTDESPTPAYVRAGCVDLNTRQPSVIAAILAGELKSESEATDVISPTDASNLATNLVSLTSNPAKGPLLNRSELVTRWISDPSIAMNSGTDQIIKRRREAAIRALADVGNTRTWNLLIDVIAQSGRYPATATNLNQFIVDGERRYWLHVALDRYTGQVVAQSLEPVYP